MGGEASMVHFRVYFPILLLWPALVGFDEPSTPAPADPTMPTLTEQDPIFFKKVIEGLKPQPLPEIPTDPPPHEGAMVQLPFVVEPPDFLLIEVLEALPGRPVSGAHLVRPDGTVTLGFYGDIYVKGLTLNQTKAKIIMHLRKFLNDEALGIVEINMETSEGASEPPDFAPLSMPDLPSKSMPAISRPRSPFDVGPQARDTSGGYRRFEARVVTPQQPVEPLVVKRTRGGGSWPSDPVSRTQTFAIAGRRQATERLVQVAQRQAEMKDEPSSAPSVPLILEQSPGQNTDQMKLVYVDPAQSDRVYVDVDSYNSKNYYIYGDFAVTGRYPCTGNETVLDAISFAGGMLPTADPRSVRLVRPGRNGKPSKVYPLDWKAIVEQGDAKANLQLFPGDRILVDRDPALKEGEGKKKAGPSLLPL